MQGGRGGLPLTSDRFLRELGEQPRGYLCAESSKENTPQAERPSGVPVSGVLEEQQEGLQDTLQGVGMDGGRPWGQHGQVIQGRLLGLWI